mmetsp:Transcript_14203/g.55890  ORF Transcript_14203/g.55890 Transcript_14203/m.55890 type:complete len:205 (-) Transcript_14203:28-642(-)
MLMGGAAAELHVDGGLAGLGPGKEVADAQDDGAEAVAALTECLGVGVVRIAVVVVHAVVVVVELQLPVRDLVQVRQELPRVLRPVELPEVLVEVDLVLAGLAHLVGLLARACLRPFVLGGAHCNDFPHALRELWHRGAREERLQVHAQLAPAVAAALAPPLLLLLAREPGVGHHEAHHHQAHHHAHERQRTPHRRHLPSCARDA